MATKSLPLFRVTVVVEAEGELHSNVLVHEGESPFTGFAGLETTTPVKLIEAHITRVQDPEPPKPLRPRKRRR